MATVTRYFGVTSAGLGDGTSFANRAALFSSGTISSIIRGHNFAADVLECVIEPGTYTQSVGLADANFTVAAPSRATNRLVLRASDYARSSWRACDREAEFPSLGVTFQSTTSSYSPWQTNGAVFYGIKFDYSNLNGTILSGGNINLEMYGCQIINSTSNTAVSCVGGNGTANLFDCLVKCTGTSYSQVVGAVNAYNCRIVGNLSATTGNRYLAGSNTANMGSFFNCVFSNGPTRGLSHTISNPNFPSLTLWNCVIHTVGDGVVMEDTATNHQGQRFINSFLVSSGGNGIKMYNPQNYVVGNRIRCSGTAFVGMDNVVAALNDTSAGSDAAEFVNASAGDFRIRLGSRFWGKNIGAGDENAPRRESFTGGFAN